MGYDAAHLAKIMPANNDLTALVGGGQATSREHLLLGSINRVTRVTSGGDSVTLPAADVGVSVFIINASATPPEKKDKKKDDKKDEKKGGKKEDDQQKDLADRHGVLLQGGGQGPEAKAFAHHPSSPTNTLTVAPKDQAAGGDGKPLSLEDAKANADRALAIAVKAQQDAVPHGETAAQIPSRVAAVGEEPMEAPSKEEIEKRGKQREAAAKELEPGSSGNGLEVFPFPGDSINALAPDEPVKLPANKTALFICGVAGVWNTIGIE